MAAVGVSVDVHVGDQDLRTALENDVRTGLTASPKSIPPRWFYDEEGSRLFDEITRLPEYYPTRAERSLLERHAREVAAIAQADGLVELGAGSCEKTRLLLDALAACGPLRRYVPLDISDEFLRAAAAGVADDYPGLQVHAVVGDFLNHLDRVPRAGRRLVAFLGGTIGNLLPAQRAAFLDELRRTMAPGDHVLVGTDLVKDPARIVAAYDDRAGVTAAFNRNMLRVVNERLDANFEPERFEHVVVWDPRRQWIEMRLRAVAHQDVVIEALDMEVAFDTGEEILTEVSAKFTPERIAEELRRAGLGVVRQWGAAEGEFLLTLATASAPPRRQGRASGS